MPQETLFHIPFDPTPLAPDIDRIGRASLEWATSHGLLRSAEAASRFSGWNLAELASRFHPDARGNDLLLAADLQGFFFLFDDQFDSPQGLRPEAVTASRELIDLAYQHPGTRPVFVTPATLAWADLWERSCEGMSPSWRARAAHEWCRYFTGNLVEALPRERHSLNTLDEYVTFRRQTIATCPVYDMSERSQQFEISQVAFPTPQIQTMRDLTTDVVTLCNDVASVEKEECRNDVINAVLLLERTQGLSRDAAVHSITHEVHRKVNAFVRLQDDLDDVCTVLDLSSRERANVTRYVNTALHSMMRGNYDWQRRTARYNAASIPDMRPGNLTNYLEDLVSPTTG